MTSQDLRTSWTPLLANLAEKMRLFPDDHPRLDEPLWAGAFPGPTGPLEETALTPRELLVHCAVAAHHVPLVFIDGTDFAPVKSAADEMAGLAPGALAAGVESRAPLLLARFDGLDEATIAGLRETPLGTRSLAELLVFAAYHVVHHKSQLMVYLRTIGIRPGRFL